MFGNTLILGPNLKLDSIIFFIIVHCKILCIVYLWDTGEPKSYLEGNV